MNNSISIIGGADGPTSIFLGGSLGISWLNIFGLILVVLLLVPNIIYAVKEKHQENKVSNNKNNIPRHAISGVRTALSQYSIYYQHRIKHIYNQF